MRGTEEEYRKTGAQDNRRTGARVTKGDKGRKGRDVRRCDTRHACRGRHVAIRSRHDLARRSGVAEFPGLRGQASCLSVLLLIRAL